MKLKQTLVVVLAAGIAAGTALFLVSCDTAPGTVMVPLEIPGAHYVGNQACADCHKDIVRKFPASPHARVHFESTAPAGQTGCESCHGPGSKHIESGGGANSIINPRKDPAACFQCHLDVNAEFSLPQHHPVIEGHMSCVQCHDPHGGDIFKPAGGLAMARPDESCAQCHRDQTRPFVFEHPALREGCITCHNPHGSINEKMLVESDPNLCLRCHSQVQGPNVPSGHNWLQTRSGCTRQQRIFPNIGEANAIYGATIHLHDLSKQEARPDLNIQTVRDVPEVAGRIIRPNF